MRYSSAVGLRFEDFRTGSFVCLPAHSTIPTCTYTSTMEHWYAVDEYQKYRQRGWRLPRSTENSRKQHWLAKTLDSLADCYIGLEKHSTWLKDLVQAMIPWAAGYICKWAVSSFLSQRAPQQLKSLLTEIDATSTALQLEPKSCFRWVIPRIIVIQFFAFLTASSASPLIKNKNRGQQQIRFTSTTHRYRAKVDSHKFVDFLYP